MWGIVGCLGLGLGREVGVSGFPLIGGCYDEGSEEAVEGGFVGESSSDLGTALDFALDAYAQVGGSQPAAEVLGKFEDGKLFDEFALQQSEKLLSLIMLFFTNFGKTRRSLRTV